LGALTSDQLEVLRRVDKNAKELLDLISAVLDVSRLEAGRLPVDLREVRVAELLQEVEAETQEIREQTSVASVWKVQKGLPPLCTDPGKLKVVIKNLIGNAVKFTEKGSITVDVHSYGSGIEIDVIDTGVGISADELAVIFEPFRQLESAKTRRFGGTGLGLHIVKRLLELLGGRITVESEVGRGSTFHVRVPTSEATTG
jgi:signal transduction histidine kinase